jgi:hypothetical protein
LLLALLWLGPAAAVFKGYRELQRLDRGIREQIGRQGGAVQPHALTTLVAESFRSRPLGLIPAWWAFVPFLVWVLLLVAGFTRASQYVRYLLPSRPGAWFAESAAFFCTGSSSVWACTAAITPLVTLLFNPPWWHATWQSVAIFLWANLSREHSIPIATLFFGKIYEFSLPWYNTLVWTGITVPPAILLLAVVGTGATVLGRLRDPLRLLILLNWATLMVIRALPSAPGHDGERQLLATFPFLACLAGIGADWLARLISQWRGDAFARVVAGGVLAAAMLSAGAVVWSYHPYQLSYYNALVGGLPGATRRGLEPTYYWDAMSSDALDWLNEHTEPGQGVAFSAYPYSLEYLQRWGLLRPPVRPVRPGPTQWYVLQNRPGSFRPHDRWLIKNAQPAMTKSLHGVPLIWVYSYGDYEAALQQTTGRLAGLGQEGDSS